MTTIPKDKLADQPDEVIVQSILNGEQSRFELLMRRYNARLFRIGMPLLKDDMEVEETMQIAYIKAYENLGQFAGRASFATWLTRIFLNECFTYLKKKKKSLEMMNEHQPIAHERIPDMQTPDKALMSKELSKAIEEAIINLPEKYRLVFMLREVEDLSIAETVETLGISDTNVKVRLNRARTMLRNSLSSYYRNDSIFHFHLSRCDRVVGNVMNHLGLQVMGSPL